MLQVATLLKHRVAEEELTYPQPHFVGDAGCLHLFTKYTGVRELYWESSQDGRQWTDELSCD